ncbi:hypothetical protein [Mitsuaria sp. 7]|uniref:hypothetical protein n=1 Tax=Mitsuaria sp. 7 TaxID=1658665 RepID=UPI0007DE0E9B|nr:hypothetical protein [Mitsuaria sp. 7]ANH68687.1 hypothetical protein ABE85_15915 [Mitsuaria sp. 7]
MHPSGAAFPYGFHPSLFDDADDVPSNAGRAGRDEQSAHEERGDTAASPDAVDYNGPCSASALPPEFIAFRAGPDWSRARAQMQASIDTLKTFAARQGIPDATLTRFQQNLMVRDGAYYESYLPQLFGRGKRLLAACAAGIGDDALRQEDRRAIFQRMIAGMSLCGIRIVNDLARAHDALGILRDGNLRRRAAVSVRNVMEQEGLWVEQHTPLRPGRQRRLSLEVHFVTAAIAELRLSGREPRRDDPLISYTGRVADLVEPLRERLVKTLTPLRVARQLADDCLSRVSSELATWLGGEPLDLMAGTRPAPDGATSHCARLLTLVQGMAAAYGPLTMDAFVRSRSGALTLHRDAALVAVQIRRNLAAQDLALPPRERPIFEWPAADGPRRLVLIDDELAIKRAGSGATAVDALPEARHLHRVEYAGLLQEPSPGVGVDRLDPGERSALFAVMLRNASGEELLDLPHGWLGHCGDLRELAERLGDDRFRSWCIRCWQKPLTDGMAQTLIEMNEWRADTDFVIALLHAAGPERSRQLWGDGAVLSHYRAHLAAAEDNAANAYLSLLARGLALLDAPTVTGLLSLLRADRLDRSLLLEASPHVLGQYLQLVEAAAVADKVRGALLAAALFSTPTSRPHWLWALMMLEANAPRLAMLLDTVARLHHAGYLDKAEIERFLMTPEAFHRDDAENGTAASDTAVPEAPFFAAMARDQGATVRVALIGLLSLCRRDGLDGEWLQRMLRASVDGSGSTALGQALSQGASTSLSWYLYVVPAALRDGQLSLDQAMALLRADQPPDGDGTSSLVLALRAGHLDTVGTYWQLILRMQAQGIFTADQIRPLLRAESARGVPALAEAVEHRLPGAIERYMRLMQATVGGAGPMSPEQLDWLTLRNADGALSWPPADGGPRDAWPALKGYLRGLRALVEDQSLSPSQLQTLLSKRHGDSPSLLGRLMGLEDRWMLTQCLEELGSWPLRHRARHAPAVAAVLDIDELDGIVTTTVRYPGLPDVLGTLVSAVAQRWIDRSTLRLRLEGEEGPPPLLIAFEHNRPDLIKAFVTAVLGAGRHARFLKALVQRMLEARSASGCAAAHLAFAQGYDEALRVWLDAVLQAHGDGLLEDGALRQLLPAYGEGERPGRDAAMAAGHERCLDVWRQALQRCGQRGWLSAEDLAALDPAQGPPSL